MENSELRLAQLNMLHILKQVDNICQKEKISYWLDSGTLLGAVRHKGFIPWDDDLDISMPREDYERFLEIAQTHLPPNMFLQTTQTDPKYRKRFAKVRLNDSLVVEDFEINKNPGYHQGIYIDIFPMDFANNFNTFFSLKKFIYCNFLHRQGRNKIDTFFRYLLKYLSPIVVKSVGRTNWLNAAKKWYNKPNKKYCVKGLETFFFSYIEVDQLYPLGKIQFEDCEFPSPKNTDKYLKIMYGDYMKLPPEDQRLFHAHVLKAAKL